MEAIPTTMVKNQKKCLFTVKDVKEIIRRFVEKRYSSIEANIMGTESFSLGYIDLTFKRATTLESLKGFDVKAFQIFELKIPLHNIYSICFDETLEQQKLEKNNWNLKEKSLLLNSFNADQYDELYLISLIIEEK